MLPMWSRTPGFELCACDAGVYRVSLGKKEFFYTGIVIGTIIPYSLLSTSKLVNWHTQTSNHATVPKLFACGHVGSQK